VVFREKLRVRFRTLATGCSIPNALPNGNPKSKRPNANKKNKVEKDALVLAFFRCICPTFGPTTALRERRFFKKPPKIEKQAQKLPQIFEQNFPNKMQSIRR
jgi:hypothetical protein